MAMTNEDYERLEPIVKSIARSEWKRSFAMTAEDLEQELWLSVLERWGEFESMEEALLRWTLRREARAIAKGERIGHMYAAGAFVYMPKYVRRHLTKTPDTSPDPELWQDVVDLMASQTRRRRDAVLKCRSGLELSTSEKNLVSAAVADVTAALNDALDLAPVDPTMLEDSLGNSYSMHGTDW